MKIRAAGWGLAILACCANPDPEDPVSRGARALVQRQRADGSWTAARYLDLQQGPALTSLALFTLSRLPEPIRKSHADSVDRALSYLIERMEPDGQIGKEYPNFTTAFCLRAVLCLKPKGWEEWSRRMSSYLVRMQCTPANGWAPSDPGFGGWGLGGGLTGGREKIRLDVSTARHMIQAIQEAGRVGDIQGPAREFLQACRNLGPSPNDGGSCYSRANPHMNKAGAAEGTRTGFRSYSTATADGLAGWVLLGGDPEPARSWLEKNFSTQVATGLAGLADPWDRGLLYYHLYSCSVALELSRSRHPWRSAIRARLTELQDPDGSWTNPHSIMKEDETLIATCFAILAWASAQEPS